MNGSTLNKSPLYIAIFKSHKNIVELLLRYPEVIANINSEYEHDTLYIACSKNELEIAKLLVQNGAKSFYNDNSDNLLHLAIKKQITYEIVDWLMRTFPELLFEENGLGITPIHLAHKNNNSMVLNYVATIKSNSV
jgi:ankyrin repeat protein